MAFVHGRNAVVLYGAYNLSPYLNSAALNATGETGDTTCFGQSWRTAIAGLLTVSASFGGFHDVDIVGAHENTLGTDGGVLTYCPGNGSAVGDAARMLSVVETAYNTTDPVADVVAYTWDVLGETSLGIGQLLHPPGTDTNTTTGAEKDDGAATATGWMAHLHVAVVDGGSWVIKLQDAAVSNTYTDVTGGAFTAATGVTSQRLTSAAATTALRRYVRYVATRTGGTAGDGIRFTLAYARNI